MKDKIIYAVSGWKYSGKDTFAAELVERGFKRFGFADVLKEMAAQQYDIPIEYMYDPKQKEKALLKYEITNTDGFSYKIHNIMEDEMAKVDGKLYWTPRAVLILEGSVKRSVNPNYWVDRVVDEIINSEHDSFVISDLRYNSEVNRLRYAFGPSLKTVRINRFEVCKSLDASERDLDNYKFDLVIDNKTTIEDFVNKIKDMV